MRSNKAIAVAGCILHQSLMARNCETSPAIIKNVIKWALRNDVGLLPWTCPETTFVGLPRRTKGIEGYRKLGMENHAANLSDPFAEYVKIQIEGGIDVLGIVGISFSPACSAARQAYHKNEQGLYIQALVAALSARDIKIPVLDINRKKDESIVVALNSLLPTESDLN